MRDITKYTVKVWFATASYYRIVGAYDSLEKAQRAAVRYDSDARGIQVITPNGFVVQVKQESR